MSIDRFRRAGRGRAPQHGFTLVELMVTIAVLAVILAIGIPSFATLTNRNRLTATSNELVAALQTARMEAVRRNTRVGLCPSTTGSACAGTSWARLVIFADADNDGSASADEVVRDVEIVRPGTPVTVTGDSLVATNQRVRFGADGRIRVGSGGGGVGAFVVTSSKLPAAEGSRRVEMAASRISVCTPTSASSPCPP